MCKEIKESTNCDCVYGKRFEEISDVYLFWNIDGISPASKFGGFDLKEIKGKSILVFKNLSDDEFIGFKKQIRDLNNSIHHKSGDREN